MLLIKNNVTYTSREPMSIRHLILLTLHGLHVNALQHLAVIVSFVKTFLPILLELCIYIESKMGVSPAFIIFRPVFIVSY